jgi:NAD+ synthase (glutamine-hydrolysing)
MCLGVCVGVCLFTADQARVPFGEAVLEFLDTSLACETCEELFMPNAPHIDLALNGVEVVSNGSGSHHSLRKLNQRLDLISNATAKSGGVYLYANQRGCDGGRLYYDGCACILINGNLVKQAAQFSLSDVEVIVASLDLDDVTSFRGAIASMQEQMSAAQRKDTVHINFQLCNHQLS